MRRDICYYFDTDVKTLYNAYLTAASSEPFGRDCKKEPYHTLTFGLNFSMKYNFNGGSCILHFIPYNMGAAVDMRFVLAQGGGGRCGRYAEDLNSYAEKVLNLKGMIMQIPIELFVDDANKVVKGETVLNAVPQKKEQHCINCGLILPAGSKFCPKCGTKQEQKRVCMTCGTEVGQKDSFCFKCGSKL